jgi:rhodanese-related sulfurtransferase
MKIVKIILFLLIPVLLFPGCTKSANTETSGVPTVAFTTQPAQVTLPADLSVTSTIAVTMPALTPGSIPAVNTIPVVPSVSPPSRTLPVYASIAADALKQKMIKGETDFILVDARDKVSWDIGHLQYSILIEPGTSGSNQPREDVILQLKMLPPKSLAILYDDGFSTDAISMAAELIKQNEGYDINNIMVLTGGFFEWLKSGYQIEIDGQGV